MGVNQTTITRDLKNDDDANASKYKQTYADYEEVTENIDAFASKEEESIDTIEEEVVEDVNKLSVFWWKLDKGKRFVNTGKG